MLRIAGIERESIVDGKGIRYVIFTQGCSHNCLGCHNPETHDFNGGKLVDITDILKEIKEDPLLDGITLSGGDPFFQASELITLCKECKKLNLDIWAYTGFTFENLISDKENNDRIQLLKNIDILVDGKFILENRTFELVYRGSTNQRLIDVQKSIRENKTIILEEI